MKTKILLFGVALGASACSLFAQQQTAPAVPGLNMPMSQQPAKQQDSPAKPSKPNRNGSPPETMPDDMKSMGNDAGNEKAQENSASEKDSARQQANQVLKKPGDSSDQQSLTVPIQELQEPEALEFRTGTDMPGAGATWRHRET